MLNIHTEEYCKENIKTIYFHNLKEKPTEVVDKFLNAYHSNIIPYGGNRIYFICEYLENNSKYFNIKAYNNKSRNFDLFMNVDLKSTIFFDDELDLNNNSIWTEIKIKNKFVLYNIKKEKYLYIGDKCQFNITKDIDNVNIFTS